MKIEYASNDNYLLTGRTDSVTKTVKEVLEQAGAGEKPVQITISKEGYECYRSNLSNLEGFTQREEPDSQIMELYGKALLDVAYENFAEGLGKYLRIAQEQDEILREHIAQLARDSGKYSSRKREENSDIKPIIKTEDIYQTMLLTRNNFKNKYSIFKSQDTIKKEVADMIHQLFNRKVF